MIAFATVVALTPPAGLAQDNRAAMREVSKK